MALQIQQKEEMTKVLGVLNSENSEALKNHIEYFLKDAENFILNLESVSEIVAEGAYAMEQLYLDFAQQNRAIYIVGNENKQLVETMKATKTSYILSDDHI